MAATSHVNHMFAAATRSVFSGRLAEARPGRGSSEDGIALELRRRRRGRAGGGYRDLDDDDAARADARRRPLPAARVPVLAGRGGRSSRWCDELQQRGLARAARPPGALAAVPPRRRRCSRSSSTDGALAQLTASSLAGAFGRDRPPRSASSARDGLVHVLASDAHDAYRPPAGPDRRPAAAARRTCRDADAQFEWLTEAVPAAILAGEEIPPAATAAAAAPHRPARTAQDLIRPA